MTVFVDSMRARYGRMVMCHMIAETNDELHRMAAAIGVARKWFQGDHYDICLSKRARAVAAGAVEITWTQAGLMLALKRKGYPMAPPETAKARYLAMRAVRKEQLK